MLAINTSSYTIITGHKE
ncbi:MULTISPECIES: hypothetical protein [Streptococcus]|nr:MULTISPECIES: hypothetical protein [Streptococcus]